MSISQKRFIQEALIAHNELRAQHGVAPLELDDDLTRMALDWSDNLANTGSLKYSKRSYRGEEVGENILRCNLQGSGSIYFSGDKATLEWYKQEADYAYDGQFTVGTGNFTQVVWKSSRKVGFAFTMTEDAEFYVVAQYWPAGNYRGQYTENVPRRPGSYSSVRPAIEPAPHSVPAPKASSSLAPVSSFSNGGQYAKPLASSFQGTNRLENIPRYQVDEPITAPPMARGAGPKAPPAAASSQEDMQTRFIREALDAHNRFRAKHGCPPLAHNQELSNIAKNYAQYLAGRRTMVHSSNKYRGDNLGENLAYAFDSTKDFYSGEQASKQWYDEIKDHDFQRDHQKGTGHFTQLVWKSSTDVGFGVARAADGSFYAVANYYPAGNFIGRYVINVPRPLYS